MIATGKRAAELIGAPEPAADLGAAIDAVIAANPDKASMMQNKARDQRPGLLGFFVGQVMKAAPNCRRRRGQLEAIRDRLS